MRNGGFTLLELLIVIAIIAIIAVIAIPNIIEARKASNEAAAVANLRQVHVAQEMYRDQDKNHDGRLDFAPDLATLRSTNALLDATLGSGEKQGYRFRVTFADEFSFTAIASPLSPGKSGDRYFLIDDIGVIRFCLTGEPTGSSPPIEGN
jgi:prepilin-type N-terminal cleavage/methylation domain-containing protein